MISSVSVMQASTLMFGALFNHSIQFSLFPAHINISYSNNNVLHFVQEKGRTEDNAYGRPSPNNKGGAWPSG